MTSTRRNVLGFLSVWPIAYVPLLMVGGLGLAGVSIAAESGLVAAAVPAVAASVFFTGMMIGHLALFASIFGLTIYYAWHALTQVEGSQEARLLWALLVVLGNALVFPVYWWIHMREGGQEVATV